MLMMRNGLSLHPMSLSGGLRPSIFPQTGLNIDEGNGFRNSVSANDESLVRSAFSFPEHCSISNQSIPSVTNIATLDTSSSFQPSIKVHVGYFNLSIPWIIIFINNTTLFVSVSLDTVQMYEISKITHLKVSRDVLFFVRD